jgi:hypothetical protein
MYESCHYSYCFILRLCSVANVPFWSSRWNRDPELPNLFDIGFGAKCNVSYMNAITRLMQLATFIPRVRQKV